MKNQAIHGSEPTGLIAIDELCTISSFSAGAQAIFDQTAAETIGEHVGTLIPELAADKGGLQALESSAANNELFHQTLSVSARRRDGTIFPASLTIAELTVGSDELRLLSVRDKSNDRATAGDSIESNAEAALNALHDIATDSEISFEEKVAKILHLGTRYFDLEQGVVARIDDENHEILYCEPEGVFSAGQVIEPSRSYCSQVFAADDVAAWHNAGESELRTEACFQEFSLNAYIGTTLFLNNAPFGTLSFVQKAPRARPFTSEEKTYMRLTALWLSSELSRQENLRNFTESKHFLELVQDSIPDLVFVKDEEFRIVRGNPAFMEVYPESVRDSVIGTTTLESYDEKEAEAILYHDKLAIKHGFSETEETIQFPDGNKRTLHTKKIRFRDSTGKAFLLGVGHDITALKKTEAQLRLEKDRMQEYLNTVDVLIVSVDAEGHIRLVNRKACEVLGYQQSELLGKRWGSVCVPEKDVEALRALFRECVTEKKPLPEMIENHIVTRSGEERLVRWRNAYQRDDKGQITGTISAGEDITDSLELTREKERLETEMQQMQKMETIGQLTGGIAHDFNNILASIMGNTELAQLETATGSVEKISRYLDAIRLTGIKATELVSQLLVYSRASDSAKEPVDLNRVVNDSFSMLRSLIPSSIDIQAKLRTDMPNFHGNHVQLQQILMNLCLNSRDALDSADQPRIVIETAQIELKSRQCHSCFEQFSGGYIKLTVADNGCGIEKEALKRICDPFFTSKPKGKGTGMGLSMVHGIVHIHGGHMLISSELGNGTVVEAYFPSTSCSENVALDEEEASSESIQHDYALKNKHILLVDDEPLVADMMSEYLRIQGMKVSVFQESTAALEAFSERPGDYSAVITDQTMPKMSGLELIQKIKTIEPTMPVLLCSGYSDLVNDANASEHGVDHFFNKPVRLSQITDTLSQRFGTG